uniref:DUF4283 domain-containing protein n=1 Tax=Vitis vinifera TaxID=29760 RepID=A5AV87_VITVI|nr:hypothetical protein VITISV_034246 [Vitis vinifera]
MHMRGGKSGFAVDAKSFEISKDAFREKLKGIIMERSRGFTSWIKFGGLSLCCLLEGVEACCKGEHAKRTESRVGVPEENAKESFADVLKSRVRRLGEAVWLQLGEKDVLSRRELLDWCLVGRWGEHSVSVPDLSALDRITFVGVSLCRDHHRSSLGAGLQGTHHQWQGSNQGCVLEADALPLMDPLRVILVDGRVTEGSSYSSKELGIVEEASEDFSERAIQEDLEEGEEAGTHSWSSSCLAKFSHCIGMPTEGGDLLCPKWGVSPIDELGERQLREGFSPMDEVLMSEVVRFQGVLSSTPFFGAVEEACREGGPVDGRRCEKWPPFHDLEGWVEGKSSIKLRNSGIESFGWGGGRGLRYGGGKCPRGAEAGYPLFLRKF